MAGALGWGCPLFEQGAGTAVESRGAQQLEMRRRSPIGVGSTSSRLWARGVVERGSMYIAYIAVPWVVSGF